jgi:hypothetical protein
MPTSKRSLIVIDNSFSNLIQLSWLEVRALETGELSWLEGDRVVARIGDSAACSFGWWLMAGADLF